MELYVPTKVYDEAGCICNHATQIRSLGTKAMIVTGKHSAKACGALADVIAALNDMPHVLFDQVEENPSIETVMEARQIAIAEKADLFIGIGGGSPMDAAKAIALMAANPGETEEVLYNPKSLKHYPVVCIPTTCGTGSEVTPYAILTRHALRTKKSINHKIFPTLALLDATYLKTMSRTGVINTCVDALSHLLESYLNTNSNQLNRLYSREGLYLWGRFKDRLLADCLTEEDYATMLRASMVAGMAITHTGTSLPHGMSYPVTYERCIPHGRAVGMFLGGFVETYGDQAEATAAVQLLGFETTAVFHAYLNQLLGCVEVPEDLLRRGATMLLKDPVKLKNYPFPLTVEAVVDMAN